MFDRLETYYMANKSDNIYFALLADVTTSSKKEEEQDKEIASKGLEIVERLNKKYPDFTFPKFHFIYRNREWNDSEEAYLGWERKRGMLNQFNEYILKHSENEFRVNTIDIEKMPQIKYVITLDADTELVIDSGLELIDSMAHILSKPEIKDGIVVDGYGMIGARVGITLEDAATSKFTKLYAGSPGTDSYTNAISDIYQDNFKEGIYTGKGIYDVEVFSELLKDEIPENTVLSHDLLEGSYLKCGYASDILLMDGFPKTYQAYKTRLLRWTRGDIQIAKWLGKKVKGKNNNKKKNPLNIISKYKIFNNIEKIVLDIVIILGLCMCLLLQALSIKTWPILALLIFSAIIPEVIEIINRIIYKKDGEKLQRTFHESFSGIKGSIIRGILNLGLLPDKAFSMLKETIKAIYRMSISKKHLLEWTTSEDAEKNSKTNIISYYKNMIFNVVLGIIFLAFSSVNIIFGILRSLMDYYARSNKLH